MRYKILFALISTTFINISAEDLSKNIENLINIQEQRSEQFTETIQLMSREEKMEMINAHIKRIEQERAQMQLIYEQGLSLQNSIQEKIMENDKKIEEKEQNIIEYKRQLESINQNLVEVRSRFEQERNIREREEKLLSNINHENVIVLSSRIPLLNRENAKEVSFFLEDGSKLDLIEYKIQRNDTLSSIISATYFKKPKWIEIEERMKIVVEMNENINNPNRLNINEIIYIPYFK